MRYTGFFPYCRLDAVAHGENHGNSEWGEPPRPRCIAIPYSLFPIPYSLFPIPYSLFPIPYSLFPIPYSLVRVDAWYYPGHLSFRTGRATFTAPSS
ncbi:MAG: hypothetical protein F6K26_01835 [Moorea sp. SIO2I5]|nr:hypothetical protein [Moorena sp. SIO2I5]